jgi:hypothetical protein
MRPFVTITLIVAVAVAAFAQERSDVQSLTPVESAAGWKILFGGQNTDAWRGYHQKTFPTQGWVVADGCLKTVKGAEPGDLITADQYADFELTLEWKIAENGNSGIMYRVTEAHDETWQTGPEYQLLDDRGAKEPPDSKQSAGAMFDLYPAAAGKVTKPPGEFNQTRIRLQNGVVQHWLNGVKVVEARLDTPEWKERIAASKFKDYDGFGLQPRGHIALQHHGDEVWFRNIRIRDLAAPLPGEVRLFNGKDLTGWKACLPDNKKMEDVWSVADGILVCLGKPNGYIRTETDYTNYVLKVEWRFNPVTKVPGNSGVLLRVQPPDKLWPKSIEAQLESGNAGDFWNIDEFQMKVDPARTQGRNTKKTHGAERPVGEWNEYEITVNHGDITLKVNGEVLNEAHEAQEIPGKIALQSEGAEIHFRNIRLSPLP